jgi:SAM-dependent methyltransferase
MDFGAPPTEAHNPVAFRVLAELATYESSHSKGPVQGGKAKDMELKPRSSPVNGLLWGARARDWAEIQEGTVRPVYEAALSRTAVGPGTHYLDIGCGSGMAAQLAAARGALVSGIDAADNMLAIARERTPEGDFHTGDLEALPSPSSMPPTRRSRWERPDG